MKLNCLAISVLSLIIFVIILYLVNKNNNIFTFKSIENYEDQPLQTVILNARKNVNDPPTFFDIKQLICDNTTDNTTDNNLCLNKYTLSYQNIIP